MLRPHYPPNTTHPHKTLDITPQRAIMMVMMVARLSRWGSSIAIAVPRPYLKQLGWSLGQLVVIHVDGDQFVARALPEHLIRPRTPSTTPHHEAQNKDS